MFLGRKHYVNVRNHLKEMKFYDELRNKLKNTKLIYPQRNYNFEEHFCNEEVYGNLNLIKLTGLVRVDKLKKTKDLEKNDKDFYNFNKDEIQFIIDRINQENYSDMSDFEMDELKINF